MKEKIVGISICMLMIATAVSSVSACTGFTYSDNENVFACHNEDWHDFFTLRFFPATEDRYGCMFIEVYILRDDGVEQMYPFSGMNDQGLWYSMYATPYLEPVNDTEKPNYYDPYSYYRIHIGEPCLFKCSTIDEALDLMDNYNHNGWGEFQVLMAEGTGKSVIHEGDDLIYKEGNFQVVTNFLQTNPELGGYPCERYDTVVSMLENMTEPSVDYFADILNATHKSKWYSWTCHSMVCDLSNQMMYLYYFGDYEKQVVIDLNEELQKGEHSIFLGSLFEPEGNQPPNKPQPPIGNESGVTGEYLEYFAIRTSDPDGDKISYQFDWGDGDLSFWLFTVQGTISSSHKWNKKGTYEVRVKAMDQYGAESEWSDPLEVTLPKNKGFIFNFPLLNWLFERFPNVFPTLRHMLWL